MFFYIIGNCTSDYIGEILMYSKGLTVYFMEKCDIIASVDEKGEHRQVYECKRLNDV